VDGDGMEGDIKARTKRERKGVVGGEGWVKCAELARGGARDRGKKPRRTWGYATWQVLNLLLAEEESIKSSEEEMWQGGLTRKVTPMGWSPGGLCRVE